GERQFMATTRMQPAIPITVTGRTTSWRAPLERHQQRLAEMSGRVLVLQFGGAAGTLEKLGDRAAAVRTALAGKLGLADAPQWHSQRDALAELLWSGRLALPVRGADGKLIGRVTVEELVKRARPA
ncbi:hypothetical protein EN844_31265, partial [Mesorhizobium sp. M3A.F.Ca.ET.201.01.1.1]|uniref:lyase family protein n=1 Tax=Mesorhizobium sp. M3A.F.Ca.ET.201.01.1.1 TaxID=2563946 RepID=UPI001133843E